MSSSRVTRTYTAGLLLALKMTDISLFNTATNPSMMAGADNSCEFSLAMQDSAELSVVSGLRRDSLSCLRALVTSLTALDSLPEATASRKAGRSSPDRTVGEHKCCVLGCVREEQACDVSLCVPKYTFV